MFTETYFQGNCLQDDILLPLPLLLALSPNISVAIVTGYREGTENFKRKIENLNAFVNTNVGLKENEGCKEITLFDNQYSTTGTGNCVPFHLLLNFDEVIYHEIESDPYWIPPKPLKRGWKPPIPARRPDVLPHLDSSAGESEKQSKHLLESKTISDDDESGQSSSAGSIQSYVSDMSVQDIQSLLEAFNLSKYQNDFKKHLIDGAMLEGLGEEILRDDFKFKQVEVIRIMKFIREGHIPKQQN